MMSEKNAYDGIQVRSVRGRYLNHDSLHPFLSELKKQFRVEQAGTSVQGRPIEKIVLGSGPVSILMWSQMHGNESTTTKAVLDLLNALVCGYDNASELLQELTLVIIPLLNPDGAEVYTRENANGVDLNRDARERTQPESRTLRAVYLEHKPDYCFNLHDQRTIFSAGPGPSPATLSFLSPAADESRTVTASRLTAMKIISRINRELQSLIPGQIGRYDDAFNPNCIGDTFQMLETPTILVEAGHYPGDYEREVTRKYVFIALWKALESIAFRGYLKEEVEGYLGIPENEKKFFDVLIRNVQIISGEGEGTSDAGILFKEELKSGSIRFRPKIEKEGGLQGYHGHQVYDCESPADLRSLNTQDDIIVLFTTGQR